MSRGKKGLATIGEVVAQKVAQRSASAALPAPRETFPSALKRLMTETGVTIYDLAKICRVTKAEVRAWQDGEAVPTRPEFGRMKIALRQIKHFPPEFEAPAGRSEEVEVTEGEEVEVSEASIEYDRPLPELGTAERTSLVRRIAHAYLDEAMTPDQRKEALTVLRNELPRAQRRILGIPTVEGQIRLRPPPKDAKRLLKCPRCQAETEDLASHRGQCPKRKKVRSWDLDLKGAQSAVVEPPEYIGNLVSRSPAPSGDEAVRKAVSAEAEGESASTSLYSSPPTAPDLGAPSLLDSLRSVFDAAIEMTGCGDPDEMDDERDRLEALRAEVEAALQGPKSSALDLAEKCVVLADMLWPGKKLEDGWVETHDFVLGPKRASKDGWWIAAVAFRGQGASATGSAPTRDGAVQALVAALRAETKARARAAEDMARLLED